MHYVCIESNVVSSILNYEPSVPANVTVYRITDEDMASIDDGSKYFDVEKKLVLQVSQEAIDAKQLQEDNTKRQTYLTSTDWLVMRHLREKAISIPTSLTEKEYIDLENKRHKLAKAIIK